MQSVKHNQHNQHNQRRLMQILQGALIGFGAVLPGISGGVLCVVFGFYQTIMEFLANPIKNAKTHLPRLIPMMIGCAIGFLGVANLLAFLLEKYPAPSICLFMGLIAGMLPSLWEEAGLQGRGKNSFIALFVAMFAIFSLLLGLRFLAADITPNTLWYIFCGFCLSLSLIAPGMSFSTLLMPLGLYEPFVAGLGRLDTAVILPAALGALITLIALSRAVNSLFKEHYTVAFHSIIGIVIAATVMIIPFESFAASAGSAAANTICLIAGIVAALKLDSFNRKYKN